MGTCKICGKESPEVCKDNPICWNCGFVQEFYNRFTDKTMPRPHSEQIKKETTPDLELNLTF